MRENKYKCSLQTLSEPVKEEMFFCALRSKQIFEECEEMTKKSI